MENETTGRVLTEATIESVTVLIYRLDCRGCMGFSESFSDNVPRAGRLFSVSEMGVKDDGST
jgi:hypothetical protein